MIKALACAAVAALALAAAPTVSAIIGLPNDAIVETRYSRPTTDDSSTIDMEKDDLPSHVQLGMAISVNTMQSTIVVQNILRTDLVYSALPFDGIQVITLPDEVEFTSVKLQAVNGVHITGKANNNKNEITQERITFNAHRIFINLTGYTIVPNGDLVIHFRAAGNDEEFSSTGVPGPKASSTGAAQPKPSSTGVAQPEDSSTGRGVPGTGGEVDPGDGGAVGDPQISGFMGQSFQVHGTAQTVYSVLSSAKMQYNALFSFLSEGKCRQGTECFAHPGNYFGAVGVQIALESGATAKLEVTAGPVDEGMKVTIDGEPLTPSAKHLKIDEDNSLHFGSNFELLLQTRDFTLRLENSDMFLNQQVSIRTPLLDQIKQFKSKAVTDVSQLPHGILGQTWRRMSYPNRWVHLEGDLMNYIVSQGLFGVPQEMNRFKVQA